MRAPCVANLETAKELLEFGVVDEGARALIDLRHCAQTPGCEDWRNCSCTVENVWRAAAEPALLPEARARERAAPPGRDDAGAGPPEEGDLQGAPRGC